MCGIAGILRLGQRPLDPWRIQAMCDAMAHRGPDDAGYVLFRSGEAGRREGGFWIEFADAAFPALNEHLPAFQGAYAREEFSRTRFDLALGHRRLSILDLTHLGHQPMSSSDRQLWISHNGEIYNLPELRNELESKGHVFRSRTDTEALLHLWEQDGRDGLERLDGMFAFALYDRAAGVLTLARDRFGVKPLYVCQTRDFFLFASEPKGILASGLVSASLDPDALAEYLTFQNVLSDRTVFAGIRLLPPGAWLELRPCANGVQVHEGVYAPPPGTVTQGASTFESAAAEVADAFSAAVRRQLLSDAPVGAYLSGGMDSGSIVAAARSHIPRLTTFTGGFDLTNVSGLEQGFDERPLSERLSYLLQTEHYEVVLHAGDMPAAMERLTWHVDDPRLGMCHQNWYVAKLASRFVKVCLAGAGGDELFGGYPWRYRHALQDATQEEFDAHTFATWHRLLPPDRLRELLEAGMRPHLDHARSAFDAVMAELPAPDPRLDVVSNLVQRALHFEYRTFLRGFLVIEDRISMAHGLESRVPFLDNRLAEVAWSIPPRWKIALDAIDGTDRGSHLATADGKLVLRKAMERFLPQEFTSQRKQGFSPPDENWYRGPSMSYVRDILLDRRTRSRSWLDAGAVERTLEEHFEGRVNHRLLIWSLLSLEWLQRHYLDGAISRPS